MTSGNPGIKGQRIYQEFVVSVKQVGHAEREESQLAREFVGDPEVWKIVDGQLYLNLDRNIQKMWFEDIPGNIVKADQNWPNIKDKAPADL